MDNKNFFILFLYKINGGNIGFQSFPMEYYKKYNQMKKRAQKMVTSDKWAISV